MGAFVLCVNGKGRARNVAVLPFRSTCLSADRDYIDERKALTCGKGRHGLPALHSPWNGLAHDRLQ